MSKALQGKEIVEAKNVGPRKNKRKREISYNLRKKIYLYLVKGDKNEITNSVMLLDIDEDPKTFKEAISSTDASF